jgi:hypothetical protein
MKLIIKQVQEVMLLAFQNYLMAPLYPQVFISNPNSSAHVYLSQLMHRKTAIVFLN